MRERAETKLIHQAAGDVFRRAWWAVSGSFRAPPTGATAVATNVIERGAFGKRPQLTLSLISAGGGSANECRCERRPRDWRYPVPPQPLVHYSGCQGPR